MWRCRQCLCIFLQSGNNDALFVAKYPVPSKADKKTTIDAYHIKKITGTCNGTIITFTYKDYADDKKQMTLSHEEFARWFERHILPKQSVKYGMSVTSWHTTEKTNV